MAPLLVQFRPEDFWIPPKLLQWRLVSLSLTNYLFCLVFFVCLCVLSWIFLFVGLGWWVVLRRENREMWGKEEDKVSLYTCIIISCWSTFDFVPMKGYSIQFLLSFSASVNKNLHFLNGRCFSKTHFFVALSSMLVQFSLNVSIPFSVLVLGLSQCLSPPFETGLFLLLNHNFIYFCR